MDQDKIGKFISTIRKNKNMTQAELGDIVGVSSKAVSKWECGKTLPDISILIALSDALDVNIAELLKGEKIENITEKDINEVAGKSVKFYNKLTEKKFSKIIIFLCSILLIIVFLLLAIFVINNYDSCNLYSITSDDAKFDVSGNIVINNKNIILIIDNVDIRDDFAFNTNTIDNYQYVLSYGKYILYRKTVDKVNNSGYEFFQNTMIYVSDNYQLNNIFIKKSNDLLKININIIYENGESTEIEIPLKIEKQFSNSRLFY